MQNEHPRTEIDCVNHETDNSAELEYKKLAKSLVEAFGNNHMTEARRLASEIILDMPPAGLECSEQDDFLESYLEGKDLDDEHRDAVVGIVEDYRVIRDAFANYASELRHTDSRTASLLQLGDADPIPDDVWAKEIAIPPPKLDDLIGTFSTKGEGSQGVGLETAISTKGKGPQGVGLETAMIAGAITLARLATTPYHNAEAYKEAVFAKNFLAPICSIIGADALESALNDEVDAIAGRNIGDNMSGTELSRDIDSLMDEADRVIALHFGRKNSSNPERFDFAISNVKGIISKLVGKAQLKSPIGISSPHSMFFQVGSVHTEAGNDLKLRARGKGRGSYLRKLLKNLGYYKTRAEKNDEHKDVHPIDLYGLTMIADNNEQLAKEYAAAVVNALKSDEIIPYPSPGREKEVFIIKGSKEFQDTIREAVLAEIPDVDMELFSFKTKKGGFTDAKITGLYETGDGRVGFAPFEMQFSTPDARLTARIGGRAAHFLFKLINTYGEEIADLDDEYLAAIKDIWSRKQDYFNNRDESSTEVCLTDQSRRRVEDFWRRIARRRQHTRNLGGTALQ